MLVIVFCIDKDTTTSYVMDVVGIISVCVTNFFYIVKNIDVIVFQIYYKSLSEIWRDFMTSTETLK